MISKSGFLDHNMFFTSSGSLRNHQAEQQIHPGVLDSLRLPNTGVDRIMDDINEPVVPLNKIIATCF